MLKTMEQSESETPQEVDARAMHIGVHVGPQEHPAADGHMADRHRGGKACRGVVDEAYGSGGSECRGGSDGQHVAHAHVDPFGAVHAGAHRQLGAPFGSVSGLGGHQPQQGKQQHYQPLVSHRCSSLAAAKIRKKDNAKTIFLHQHRKIRGCSSPPASNR